MSNTNFNFSVIAQEYKKIPTDKHRAFCKAQTNLKSAIEVASRAIDEREKIHGHQRRIGKTTLDNFAKELVTKESEIKRAKTFEDLLGVIRQNRIIGIGELAIYDTADRIGAYLDIYPERIYLHAGTKTGAKKLLGNIVKRKEFLELNELPKDFLKYGLTAVDFENLFCIFKGEFSKSCTFSNSISTRVC